MALKRSYPLQATIRDQLQRDFFTFRDQEGLSDAEATRQLLALALRIKLNAKEDERPSNREVLEEIYRVVRCSSAMTDVTHAQTFNPIHAVQNQESSTERRQQIKADMNNRIDAFLNGEKKSSDCRYSFFLSF